MKKSNRIEAKGDTTAGAVQSKKPSRPARGKLVFKQSGEPTRETLAKQHPPVPSSNALAAFDKIASFEGESLYQWEDAYYLASDGGAGQPITRAAARAWLDKQVVGKMIPYEFRKDFRHGRGIDAEIESLKLGDALGVDTLIGLRKWQREGVPVIPQVAGAVAAWITFLEHMEKVNGNERAKDIAKESAGVLDCAHFEFAIAKSRRSFLSQRCARLYQELVQRSKRMPVGEAMEYLEALADLIEYHPGLSDEYKSIREMLDAECGLGESEAMKSTLRE